MDDETVRLPEQVRCEWGSDAVAAALRATGVPYIALNPGASFRGLHDSLVNYLGNVAPQLLLCLHEEHAVAIAHGYAKVTQQPMAVAVHSNVGLMHATMAIFNAYCDRVPVLVLGATGPVDADRRRPWIDWIHTAADQGALVRPYVKWDDQPGSVSAAVASLLRGNQLARTHPEAPVYVCLDAAVQEAPFDGEPAADASRYAPIADSAPSEDSLAAAVALLAEARRPVLLAGRVSRDPAEWDRRVELAERLGAAVITDLKVAAAFPTEHRLHRGTPGLFVSPDNLDLLRSADTVLSLDWVDLGGTLRQAYRGGEPTAAVISASADHTLFNGWTKNDHFLPPVDVSLPGRPDVAVAALLDRLPPGDRRDTATSAARAPGGPTVPGETLTVAHLAVTLRQTVSDGPATLIRAPLSWDADHWPVSSPLDYLGGDGGGGIGSGPGMAVGAALALRDSGRLPVAVLGDGDYLMGLTALWTAARYELPLLVVVANNRSFFNDELHQDRVARLRDRPVANAHIGMRMQGPDPDLAQLARGQGLEGIGPVASPAELPCALQRAVRLVRGGRPTVVDVRVERGYGATTAAAITREAR
ncbi:MAG: thiamine pyrophosphate-binding protein [Pseudonocardiaceae bacterium]|nr:thiamine pyrophosphate-binding protein [Pseudonocardiaceae bacterium]